MSWLSAIVDVADLAVGINNAVKLQKMQEMGNQMQVVDALRSVMREYIFQANQTKEDLLMYKKRKPIAVAAGLYYLEAELEESPISPDVFDDISDKEYVASTLRSIRMERMEMLEYFSSDQRELAETTGHALNNYEELEILGTMHDEAVKLSKLKTKYKDLEKGKPRGFFANLKSTDWFNQRRESLFEIQRLEKQIGDADWEHLVAKHNAKTKEECLELQAQMRALITQVFKDMPVPQLSIGDIFAENLSESEVDSQQPDLPAKSDVAPKQFAGL